MSKLLFSLLLYLLFSTPTFAQSDSINTLINQLQQQLKTSERVRINDSIRRSILMEQFSISKESEKREKEKLLFEFEQQQQHDSLDRQKTIERINKIKLNNFGFPVVLASDTLFFIYNRIGASTPKDRALNISKKLKGILEDEFFSFDSIHVQNTGNMTDLSYRDLVLMSVSDMDALWLNKNRDTLAFKYAEIIKTSIKRERDESSFWKILFRIGLVLTVFASVWFLIWLVNRINIRGIEYIVSKKEVWFKSLSYKDYTFLEAEQEMRIVLFLFKVAKWISVLLIFYLGLPIVFSIFPFTRGWANVLFGLIWSPFKGVFVAVWNFMPDLFSILVIYFVMRYVIRFVGYIFSEINTDKLKISGFHPDWAMPTFSIVRFLLYAFMFILIFPHLPGSGSNIFKGVSVFIGVLFSLGSSSAIANMIAGLVITYMRPFKIGDRIKIGEMMGEVIEKTLLVTRLRTIKNEEITIPNASVLSGNTINYSVNTLNEGLIVHTAVTIGYDVPWKEMHQALIDAALMTEFIQKKPVPFVLQTSLEDFYVSYQINAYTLEANRQASILSLLHQNIQDICNQRGIEIMSPHYRAQRDGNTTTIPVSYLVPSKKSQ